MTYEKFLEKILDAGIEWKTPLLNAHYRYYRPKDWKPEYGPDQLYVEWETGGVSGGSCWEDSDPRPYTIRDVREPEFKDLDKTILLFWPTIGFIQYKDLVNELVKYGDYSEHEYYGNCTNYSTKTVALKDLHAYLTNAGVFQ